jgi:hypothetical protein
MELDSNPRMLAFTTLHDIASSVIRKGWREGRRKETKKRKTKKKKKERKRSALQLSCKCIINTGMYLEQCQIQDQERTIAELASTGTKGNENFHLKSYSNSEK